MSRKNRDQNKKNVTLRPPADAAKVGSFESAGSLDLSTIERVLSRLILRPHTQQPPVSAGDRKAIERCIELCENLLQTRAELAKLAELTKSAANAVQSTQEKQETTSLKQLLQEGLAPEELQSEAERKLFDLRTRMARRYEEMVPDDLQEWLTGWDRKVDSNVGERYLGWLEEGPRILQRQQQIWLAKASSAGENTRGLGLFAKLRALRFSRKFHVGTRQIESLRRQIDARKARLGASMELTSKLCGCLAAFVRLPLANAGHDSRRMQRLILIDIERDVSENLHAEMQARAQNAEALCSEGIRRETFYRELRHSQNSLEQLKLQRLSEVPAHTQEIARTGLSHATASQVRMAFEELEQEVNLELSRVEYERERCMRANKDLQRLARILDEYTENSATTGPRNIAAVRDNRDSHHFGPRTSTLHTFRSTPKR